jgi:adenylosuccinate synthase
MGITKAYTTRVGTGPFPTEAVGEQEEDLRRRGNEFGATTGRPRRCGWFDGPGVRYASMINGWTHRRQRSMSSIRWRNSLLRRIQIQRIRISASSPDIEILGKVEPVYKNLKGWQPPSPDARLRKAPQLGKGLP